jgi:hypothetical protein
LKSCEAVTAADFRLDNLAFILQRRARFDVVLDHSKISLILGDCALEGCQMFVMYDGKLVIKGDIDNDDDEVESFGLRGLFTSSKRVLGNYMQSAEQPE